MNEITQLLEDKNFTDNEVAVLKEYLLLLMSEGYDFDGYQFVMSGEDEKRILRFYENGNFTIEVNKKITEKLKQISYTFIKYHIKKADSSGENLKDLIEKRISSTEKGEYSKYKFNQKALELRRVLLKDDFKKVELDSDKKFTNIILKKNNEQYIFNRTFERITYQNNGSEKLIAFEQINELDSKGIIKYLKK